MLNAETPRAAETRRGAGVAKAHSDVVLISGHDGGTGASPHHEAFPSGLLVLYYDVESGAAEHMV